MSSKLAKFYSTFLDNNRTDVWHADASLHYITTLITVAGSGDIAAHFRRQAGLFKTKEQKILSTIETGNSLVVEVATTLEFENGGGAILPNLDDNFLADQVVTTPMIHFVTFDGEKVKQVRLYWDQSSLLKQISIIGKSGMNWPIRDGKEQVALIKSSIEATPGTSGGSSRGSSPSRSQTSSAHGNRISLFAPREAISEEPAVAPKGSLKPHQRDLTAIIGEGDEDPVANVSPAKAGNNMHAPKRTFFVGQTPEEQHSTPDRRYKSNPKKFSHFELVDPSDQPAEPAETPKPPKRASVYGKPGPSWGFEDFTTPLQNPIKSRPHADRHFGWSEDEEPESPVRQPAQPKPRKDANHQFEFTDESPEKQSTAAMDKPLNRNGQLRQKNMSHFDIVDESPADKPKSNGKAVPESRKTVVKSMDKNWSDGSPNNSEIENRPIKSTGIKTTGDGMGGRKGQASHWDFTDESSPIQNHYSENTRNKAKHATQPSSGSFWDF